MTARWDCATAGELAARWGVPAVHLLDEVGSTNDAARALAEAGAPGGTVVLAERQTAGRGRGGKAWQSPPGLGIWMSVVLRPPALPAPGLLPLLVGLGAAEGMEPFAGGAAVRVKWPNDVYLDGRKAGGILCEGSWDGAGARALVAGIGLNVLHGPDDFADEVRETATSLRIASVAAPSRADVAGAVVAAVLRRTASPPVRFGGAVLEALAARDHLAGRRVSVTATEDGAEALTGLAMGITPEGALLVRDERGVLRTVKAGTVRLAG